MKRIAVVSSFSESCGNAYFTKILTDSMIEQGCEVDCLSLNLLLTQSVNKKIRAKADKHIDDICRKLKDYDGVNIQFEAGLYGTMPKDIIHRTIKLIHANPNVSVTLHSPRLVYDTSSEREAIKQALRLHLRCALRFYFSGIRSSISMRINEKIIRYLARNNINTIVHTTRAKEQIELLFNYKNISVHPLKIVPENISTNDKLLNQIKESFGFNPDVKIIGVFGFVNEYKGHSLAIQAMNYLPKDYKLMFFGRQHPQTIKNNELVNGYIQSLQEKIFKSRLVDRVFFMGEYDNEDFINLAASVDAVWLPYVENGQDGSGIASICFDVSKKVLCSTSFAFDELFRLIKDYTNYNRFDIGNYMELASKTKSFMPLATKPIREEDKSPFTLASQAQLYIDRSLNNK